MQTLSLKGALQKVTESRSSNGGANQGSTDAINGVLAELNGAVQKAEKKIISFVTEQPLTLFAASIVVGFAVATFLTPSLNRKES